MRIARTKAWLVVALLLAACESTPPPAEGQEPRLTGSVPSDGATGVGRQQPLSIEFSAPLVPSSLVLSSTPPVDLSDVQWPAASRAVATPGGGWPAGAEVTVSVAGEDSDGRELASGTRVRFTVVAASPDEDAPPATPTGVVATAGEGRFTLSWTANTEPDLAGYQLLWGSSGGHLDGAVFTAVPGTSVEVDGLVDGTAYAYRLYAEDEAGNRSPPVEGSVTPIDETPPTLTTSVPADGSTALAQVPVVRLGFSEPIDRGSLYLEACRLAELGGDCQEALPEAFSEVAWSNADRVAEVGATFAAGSAVRVTVSAGDLSGNPLADSTSIQFALAEDVDLTPPTIADFSAVVSGDTHRALLEFRFSEAMDAPTTESAFASQPALACTWTWPRDDVMTCHSGMVEQLTTFEVVIGTGAADLAGNGLQVPYATTFDTGDLPPRLASASPRTGSLGVGISSPITLTFSEPVSSMVLSWRFRVTVDGALVPGSLEWSQDRTSFTFTPTDPYGYGKLVTWTASGLHDSGLNPLSPAPSGSFTTRFQLGLGSSGGDR